MKLSVAQLRDHLGKKISWESSRDGRGYYSVHSGILQDVKGRNLLIDGDWRYLPHMYGVKLVLEELSEQNRNI